MKPVTHANYVRHLRAFFRYGLQEKLITADLSEGVRLERVPRHFPKALLVFESAGRPVDPHTCSDTVVRLARKAGVPSLTPHVMRHSRITRLIEQGVPVPVVQRFAGHADIATTMRYGSVAHDVYADQIRAALS